MEVENGGNERPEKIKHKGKHDKPKPWDEDPNIDRWTIEKFDPSWNEGGMLEVSSFSVLFPEYREKYLQEAWPLVKSALKEYGINCELDLAIKILNDDMQCDIIKIGNLIRNKERFVKRRQYLMGPNLCTLKALEILTGCYILVQGNTVSAMGSFKGLKQVRKVVEDCIQNVMHPVHHIKILMMKRELAKNPALANENWDRFLPKFKNKNVQRKKYTKKEEKPYSPFPPPQQPSKVDLQLESGEYFLSDNRKSAKKWEEKQEKQATKTAENKMKREAAFVPPKETSAHVSDTSKSDNIEGDVSNVAASLKKKAKEFKKHKDNENIEAAAYIANAENGPSKKH